MEKLEETKTAHLPRLVCLGVGLPVVLSKPTGQLVAVGVCNNSDGKACDGKACNGKACIPSFLTRSCICCDKAVALSGTFFQVPSSASI